MANYIKGTAIQENSISETKLDSSLQSWKETVTNHINNNDNPHNITKSSIGLDNVTNDAQVKRSELGVANGVATLDSTGKVPSGQLPSYVDDVIEGYLYNGVFYKDTSYTTSIVGESGKIYIDLPTNKTYRWTGSVYGVISETIALGEISSTAYRGDRGKIAYDHSQSAHAPSNAQANVIETIKVNGTALTPNSKAVDITIPTVGNGTITIKQGGTSKGTFTTNQNGNTTIELTDTNTTYTAGDGLSLSGTTFSNNGVRSISTGTTNGTISVNTNGNISNIGIYGLKSAAYTNSSDYAAASHTHSYLPLTGGAMSNTNVVTNLNADLLDGYHHSSFAKIASANNLIFNSNEFNFVPSDFAGEVYINYKTTGGSNGAITKYNFCNGARGVLATISQGQFSGNAAGLSSEYLSDLNSATYNKVFSAGFKASNIPSENYATGLTLYNTELKYLYQLAFSSSGNLFVRYYGPSWNPWKTIAFTDSNVASATNADTLDGYHASQVLTANYSDTVDLNKILEPSILRLSTDNPNSPSSIFNYGNLLTVKYPTSDTAWQLIGSYSSDSLWFRRGTCYADRTGTLSTNAWKVIAFIDSNVASATKLQTPRTIWGQSFDGTGNVSGALTGVTSITASGHAKVNSLKAANICIECDSNGNVAGHTSEINHYSNTLYLQYGTSYDCSICYGGGNVGIGTESPAYKLHVAGAIRASDYLSTQYIELIGSTPFIDFNYNSSTADYTSRIIEGLSGQLTVTGKLRVGLSYNISTDYAFHVVGDGYFTENVITESDFSSRGDAIIDGTVSCTKLLQTSDIKYKTNIKQIKYEEALKIIENLNPVTWDWNENTKISGSSSGFIAQEVKDIIPNAVSEGNENSLSLDYTQLHSYEIRVIQEQQKEIKDLKQRLEVLESLVLQLTNREI